MTVQRHLIKRQILELKIPRAAQTQSLYAEISRIHHQRIAPLLDRCCTDLSEPDHIHRIQSLELDLGYVDLKDLEAELMAKLTATFPEALALQIRRQARDDSRPEQGPQDKSRLELFEFFVRTGCLPWWSDPLHPQLLEDALKGLIADQPAALVRVVRELARRQQPLQRIVLHSREETLAALCRLLAPYLGDSLAQFSHELATLLLKHKAAAGRSEDQLRKMVWREILRTASLKGGQIKYAGSFWREVIAQTALTSKVAYAAIVSGFHRAIQTGTVQVSVQLSDLMRTLYQELPGAGAKRKELIVVLRRLQRQQGPLSGVFSLLQSFVGRWSEELQERLLAVLLRYENRGSVSDAMKGIIQVLVPALEQKTAFSTAIGRHLVNLQKLPTSELSPAVLSELTKMIHEILDASAAVRYPENGDDTSIDLSFSDADELYVNNSGLVILWPFLRSFFEQLDLMEEKQFKGEAAVRRAVGLLQYLATEDPMPPEYLLPLNKVLCGMDPTAVFDFGPPVAPDEAEECRRLLSAVVAHAKILKDMSLSGFRGTFLLRKGTLGTRDGAWLLRVERESYDVVLDRFPWSLNWIKLPWMESALRVEW